MRTDLIQIGWAIVSTEACVGYRYLIIKKGTKISFDIICLLGKIVQEVVAHSTEAAVFVILSILLFQVFNLGSEHALKHPFALELIALDNRVANLVIERTAGKLSSTDVEAVSVDGHAEIQLRRTLRNEDEG